MTQGWTLLVQPITLLLIVKYLDEMELAYYSAFNSIVALQTYFEMGLGTATLQFFSHEAGHLRWTPAGTLDGDSAAKSRLASMVRLSLKWYLTIAAAVVAILLPAGWIYFQRTEGDAGIAWRLPWVWTVLSTAASWPTIPFTYLLAGCGRVAHQVQINGLQKVLANVLQWGGLAIGAALLSWPAGQTAGVALVVTWLAIAWGRTVRDLLRFSTEGLPRVHWWRDVWPFQWRIAIGAPFNYLTAPILVLVLFATPEFGKPVAAQMGVSLFVMNALFSAVHAWIGVRTPLFGQLIARRDWVALDRTFRQAFLQSTALAVAGAIVGWSILVLLQAGGYKLGMRMLPPLPLALLLANAVVQHMSLSLAAYLRAHRRDPYFLIVIAFGLSMAVAVFTLGRTYGPTAMAGSLLVLNTLICLGGGSIVFIRCRRAWHAEPLPVN
jgi:hypothetical protein